VDIPISSEPMCPEKNEGYWRKMAEQICNESDQKRTLALSRKLTKLLDVKNGRGRVIAMRKAG
jgi:hypothetical protein